MKKRSKFLATLALVLTLSQVTQLSPVQAAQLPPTYHHTSLPASKTSSKFLSTAAKIASAKTSVNSGESGVLNYSGEEVVAYARKLCRSGKLKCSGTNFIAKVYKKFGTSLTTSTWYLARSGDEVSLEDIQPGDILYFGCNDYGIYTAEHSVIFAKCRLNGEIFTYELGLDYLSKPVTCRRVINKGDLIPICSCGMPIY